MTRDEIVKQLRSQVFELAFDGFYSGVQSEEDLRGDNLAVYVWRLIDVVVLKDHTPEEATKAMYEVTRNALLSIEDLLSNLVELILAPLELDCLTANEN